MQGKQVEAVNGDIEKQDSAYALSRDGLHSQQVKEPSISDESEANFEKEFQSYGQLVPHDYSTAESTDGKAASLQKYGPPKPGCNEARLENLKELGLLNKAAGDPQIREFYLSDTQSKTLLRQISMTDCGLTSIRGVALSSCLELQPGKNVARTWSQSIASKNEGLAPMGLKIKMGFSRSSLAIWRSLIQLCILHTCPCSICQHRQSSHSQVCCRAYHAAHVHGLQYQERLGSPPG